MSDPFADKVLAFLDRATGGGTKRDPVAAAGQILLDHNVPRLLKELGDEFDQARQHLDTYKKLQTASQSLSEFRKPEKMSAAAYERLVADALEDTETPVHRRSAEEFEKDYAHRRQAITDAMFKLWREKIGPLQSRIMGRYMELANEEVAEIEQGEVRAAKSYGLEYTKSPLIQTLEDAARWGASREHFIKLVSK